MGVFVNILPGVSEHEDRRFTGIEFALVHAEAPLFIIHKRHRFSMDEGMRTRIPSL